MGHTARTGGPPQAPTDRDSPPTDWSQIAWKQAERAVQSRRCRLFRATQEQHGKQGRHLRKLRRRSDSNVLVSVRRVPQIHRGKDTPGIEGERATTPQERAALVEALRQYQPWRASPVRRRSMPKAHGKQRPLGIPTRRDRVRQMVVKNALDPRFEAVFEAQSDGVRPGRCGQEAIEAVSVALNNSAVGRHLSSLDADLQGAFDHLSQDCILAQRGAMPGRELIKPWLQAGDWEHGTLHHTRAGTPQGGVASPLLAHIALDGRTKRLGKGYRVARDADDILVMASSQQAIAHASERVSAFLAERGLRLTQEKTRIVPRTEGVDSLGFPVQMRGQKLLITPQKQQGHALLQARRSWLKGHKAVSPEAVIRPLHPLSRGWAMYYRHVGSKRTVQSVENHLWRALWQWATRRHPSKSSRWIYRRDCARGTYGATCYAESQDRRGRRVRLRLERMAPIPIVRHVKGKGTASPDDPALQMYWRTRHIKSGRRRLAKGSKLYQLAERQRWQCPGCGQALCDGQEVHLHHLTPVQAGGSDAVENRQWLHKTCHDQQHQRRVA